ncbi:uncharacterized protein K441DRAFT_427519, partial [Cenococcum geophilum 1.58]
ERNSNQSPLLHLPAEVRNQIYAHVLGGKLVHPTARRGSLERWHKLLHLGLLDTCKQTYQEAALLSYSLNTFSLSSADTLTRF